LVAGDRNRNPEKLTKLMDSEAVVLHQKGLF
jgi:hypothetical protein